MLNHVLYGYHGRIVLYCSFFENHRIEICNILSFGPYSKIGNFGLLIFSPILVKSRLRETPTVTGPNGSRTNVNRHVTVGLRRWDDTFFAEIWVFVTSRYYYGQVSKIPRLTQGICGGMVRKSYVHSGLHHRIHCPILHRTISKSLINIIIRLTLLLDRRKFRHETSNNCFW